MGSKIVSLPRVLIRPEAVQAGAITIDRPEALRHLLRVLRIRVGDRLECFDGAGRTYAGPVIQCAPTAVVMMITEEAQEPATRMAITLAQALIKADRFAWVVQKATELGVARIIPLETQRAVVRAPTARSGVKQGRWQRIAAEAAKQCGRATVPQVDPPSRFAAVIAGLPSQPCALMPTLAVPSPLLRDAADAVRRADAVTVLIGPEGDFTPEEVAAAQQAGARAVSLGPLTLRSETAAIAVLALLQSMKGLV